MSESSFTCPGLLYNVQTKVFKMIVHSDSEDSMCCPLQILLQLSCICMISSFVYPQCVFVLACCTYICIHSLIIALYVHCIFVLQCPEVDYYSMLYWIKRLLNLFSFLIVNSFWCKFNDDLLSMDTCILLADHVRSKYSN